MIPDTVMLTQTLWRGAGPVQTFAHLLVLCRRRYRHGIRLSIVPTQQIETRFRVSIPSILYLRHPTISAKTN